MDKNFYTPENIEAYLENRLSPSERGLFESGISKDPLVRNEIGLQKDIIASLKNYRKSELKNRLNNIEVSLSPNYLGLKIASSIVVSGLIGLGIYSFFINNSNSTVINNKEAYINNTVAESSKNNSLTEISDKKNIEANDLKGVINEKNTTSISATNEPNTAAITAVNEPKTTVITNNSKIKKPSTKTVKSTKETSQTEHSSPIVAEDFESHELFEKDNNINLPDGKVAQITETKSGIDITIDRNTDKKFHYKYYNNKLFLYGNFDSKTYEILELNTYKGKQVYLYYDKSYYQLNSNQLDVSPLSKITDKKAIEDLNKFNK